MKIDWGVLGKGRKWKVLHRWFLHIWVRKRNFNITCIIYNISISFAEKFRMWDVFVESNSECIILERRCWSSEGGFLRGLNRLCPRIRRVKLVTEVEMNSLRKWPSQKTVIVSRKKGKDNGCKVSCCRVNPIRVKSDNEIVTIRMSSKDRATETRRLVINRLWSAMGGFCWIENKSHWRYPP